jgi:hypothetical protein
VKSLGLNKRRKDLVEMFARHPKTGKPIRILRSEASLSRTKKTLVWLEDQSDQIPWNRWDTLCVDVDKIKEWESRGVNVDMFLLTKSTEVEVEFFLSLNSAKYKMMFIPKALVFAIGWQKFRTLGITNVIVLEEAHLMYPFLGTAWDTTKEDGIVMIATILRMRYLSGFSSGWSSPRLSFLETQGMKLTVTDEQPMPLWYITQYYTPEKPRRAREIKKCMEKNASSSVIDKFVLLNEKDYSSEFPTSSKIHQEIVGKRLTYRMVIEWILANVPDNVICVFGNADIYLDDETWKDVWSVELDNIFLALLRWDVQGGDEPSKLFGPRNDSQDTWGFLSQCVKAKDWDFKSLEFPFGQGGCDNAITVEMLRKKFLIVNPAISLKTHHLQLSNIRTYDPAAIVDKPCYMYVDPTGFHDMTPIYDLKPYQFEQMAYSSFERPISASKEKSLDVFCKMLERGERYTWKSKEQNLFPGESIQLSKYTNAFQTPHGLAYGYDTIYVGKEEVSKEAWSKSQLSPIHPAYESEHCYAAPWHEDYAKIPEKYMLEYLPKILQMRKRFGKGEFFAPEKGVTPYMECLQWEESQLPLLAHRANVQIWCKELIQYPSTGKSEIHTEDIQSLREVLRGGWSSQQTENKWVVMVDTKYVTPEVARAWESAHPDSVWTVIYEGRTSPDRMVEALRGAKGLVCAGGPGSVSRWGLSWVLPKGAQVVEVQNEMEPDGEAVHVSGAAGLAHTLVIVPRASEKATRDMIVNEVSSVVKQNRLKAPVDSSKPVISMPRKSLTGFFGHAGDSFREMVQLWSEKGYVNVVEDSKAVQIWLNGVGTTLLYDRPTLDWLFTCPPEEQTWKLALFGNPKPVSSGGPSKSWIFWPRRPRLVEEAVAKGLADKGWADRKQTLVFYGKIENKVQEKRRKQHDWSSVCDEYEMVNGEGTAYKYGPEQYLEKLSEAKFGLCLAGFGKKCHREVECMAMGCVPVCAEDVDMETYANPPTEGVHYIRVKDPSEISGKVSSMSEEAWLTMSKACKVWWNENASAEGSWKVTQTLTAN